MANKLVIIAVAGLGVCAVCLGIGSAIGGGFVSIGGFSLEPDDGRPKCGRIPTAAATSRTLAWDGSDSVRLVVLSDARYTPGTDGMLHASGDPQMLAHLRVRGGTIELDCRGWRDRDEIKLTLPGREFRKFAIAGRSDLVLEKLSQDSVKIDIAGTGTIRADGKVADLAIKLAGVGHADFGRVVSRNASAQLAGVATADIAPTESATIKIAGPSTVNLRSNPKILDTSIAGPGHLNKLGDD
jgi:hypothetical protein